MIHNRINTILIRLISFLFILVITFACNRGRNHPGYEFAGDMSKSQAYETYSDNLVFADGKTALRPVAGTVPREMIPYQFANNEEGLKLAGLELKNPLKVNNENIERGKEVYDIFCLVCHGETALGDGILFTNKTFPIEPTSLLDEKSTSRPDGEIYHIITNGGAAMGPHAAQIRPDDRWKVIMYVRNRLEKGSNE